MQVAPTTPALFRQKLRQRLCSPERSRSNHPPPAASPDRDGVGIAREKKGKGHPIFAKRLDVASFPTTFTLGPQDSMMGGAPPDNVSVEARIDLDHDAMTKEPGAPSAKIESVSMGSKDLTLTLKP